MMDRSLEIDNLTKSFGGLTAPALVIISLGRDRVM